MRKKELNLGEQLVEALTKDLLMENFDDCIVELPFDNLGSITKYKYQFNQEGHILDGVIVTYERGFEANDYYVKHNVLQYYSIFYDIPKELFYAMYAAYKRSVGRKVKANEKKIVDYLNARNNSLEFREPVVLDFEPTVPIETIKAAVDKALDKYLKQV